MPGLGREREQARLPFLMEQLREVRVQIAEYSEKLGVAEDILKRIEIISPQSGMIQNLKVHTIGGVIGQGMESLRWPRPGSIL